MIKKCQVCDYFLFNDRTEEVELLKYENYRATHDMLTGLLNKEQFYYRNMLSMIKEHIDTKYCIICSNIKDFKFVNELFGVEKGNEILRKQAEYIKDFADEEVVAARLRGDRFAMCMPKVRFDEKLIDKAISGNTGCF